MLVFLTILLIIYVFIIVIITNNYKKKTDDKLVLHPENISIIIPYRNEEDNIEKCLESIVNQKFDKEFEIILVNDHSNDNSEKIAKQFIEKSQFLKVQVLSLPQNFFGKKNGVIEGVKHAKHPVVCTFDADCVASENWLNAVSKAFQSDKTKMALGEVVVKRTEGFLNLLQHSESVLTSIFIASGVKSKHPLLISAANMAFRKDTFIELNPYADNIQLPSGDDIFLMEKVLQNYGGNAFDFIEKEVYTNQVNSFEYYFRQRVRWLGKMKYAKSLILTNMLSFFIGIVNTALLFLLFFNPKFAILFGVKFIVDVFLLSTSKHTHRSVLMLSPILFLWWLIYPLLLFISSFLLKKKWKGRVVKV